MARNIEQSRAMQAADQTRIAVCKFIHLSSYLIRSLSLYSARIAKVTLRFGLYAHRMAAVLTLRAAIPPGTGLPTNFADRIPT